MPGLLTGRLSNCNGTFTTNLAGSHPVRFVTEDKGRENVKETEDYRKDAAADNDPPEAETHVLSSVVGLIELTKRGKSQTHQSKSEEYKTIYG